MPESLADPAVAAAIARARQPGAAFPSPADWRDHWIYFLLVDRFDNPAAPPRKAPFDDPTFDRFQGGTYAGVAARLPYLKELGVGAIWLAPILKNLQWDDRAYHGYWIHDFLRAEPRFATAPERADDELRSLVDAAHAAGVYVIFDIVLNHAGDIFAYDCRPDDTLCGTTGGAMATFSEVAQPIHWRDEHGTPRADVPDVARYPNPSVDAVVWPAELQRNDCFRRQGRTSGDSVLGDFNRDKQFRTDDPAVQTSLIDAYRYVIARFDCDGFRIDTLRYLQGDMARRFGSAMREFALSIGKANFFTFGEVFDANSEEDIAHFIGIDTVDGGDLVGVDAALDFPLQGALAPIMKGTAAPQALVDVYQKRRSVEQDVVSSHGDATRFFVTFLDNHDLKQRFYRVDPGNPGRYDDQLTMALACLYTLQGIPCLYYGTEQGLHGGGTADPAVREALWGRPGTPFDTAAPFYRAVQAIARTRAGRPALRYGRQYPRPLSGDGQMFGISTDTPGVLAYSRILDDDEVVVIANPIEGTSLALFVLVDATRNPVGSTFRVLYSNRDEPTPPDPVGLQGHTRAIRVHLRPFEVQVLGR